MSEEQDVAREAIETGIAATAASDPDHRRCRRVVMDLKQTGGGGSRGRIWVDGVEVSAIVRSVHLASEVGEPTTLILALPAVEVLAQLDGAQVLHNHLGESTHDHGDAEAGDLLATTAEGREYRQPVDVTSIESAEREYVQTPGKDER